MDRGLQPEMRQQTGRGRFVANWEVSTASSPRRTIVAD
jgi:hypothetical protein